LTFNSGAEDQIDSVVAFVGINPQITVGNCLVRASHSVGMAVSALWHFAHIYVFHLHNQYQFPKGAT
jgi:hypothetical protein